MSLPKFGLGPISSTSFSPRKPPNEPTERLPPRYCDPTSQFAGRLLTLPCTSIRHLGREPEGFHRALASQFGNILSVKKTFASGQETNGRKNSMLLRIF